MFQYLIARFVEGYAQTPLRLIDYVTFRAAAALATAFLLCVLLGPLTVRILKNRAVAPERLEGILDEKYLVKVKSETPSMGGILVSLSIIVSALLWGDLSNGLLMVFVVTVIAFSVLGFIDDYIKIQDRKKPKAERTGCMKERTKMISMIILSLGSLCFLWQVSPDTFCQFCVPFIKEPLFTMPLYAAFAFGALVVVGTSNAVNLTDGKDGLAVGCTIFCVLAYGAFAYMTAHKVFAAYLNLNYIPESTEVVVFSCAIVGACIGFLWFNCNPASMFMGDVGSLALGASIGLIAVLVKQEILLVFVGGVFVLEAGSVLLQRLSCRYLKRKVFKCAPIHHHFELSGWTENQIVVRFWIIAGLLALIGLATLKLR